jgi:three-Cys-motif partner protein
MAPSAQPIGFFDDAKPTSLHKLDIFGKYLPPLTYKLGSGWKNIWIVDGFAGVGAYRSGQSGSPRLAAQWARREEMRRGHPLVRCINVERDPDCFVELERNLAPWKHLATNLSGTFAERLDEILNRIGRDPAFFFLDPFGVNGIEMAVIERILARKGRKTELLIHFSDKSFKRMAGHSDEDDDRTPLAKKLAGSKLARLDEVMGTKLWRPWWEGDKVDTDAALDATAKLYLSQLRERGFRYAHEIPIRETLDSRPPYRLVFCTESPHGVELMSDITCVYERRLWDRAHEGTFDLLLSEEARGRGDGALRDRIHELGVAHGMLSRQEIIHTLAPQYFGEYRSSEYAKAVRELVSIGGIDRSSATGIEDREALRFVELAQQSLLGG